MSPSSWMAMAVGLKKEVCQELRKRNREGQAGQRRDRCQERLDQGSERYSWRKQQWKRRHFCPGRKRNREGQAGQGGNNSRI